jgi:hypothetical protein
MKLKKFKSKEEIGGWVAPPDYFPGQDIALSIGLKCPQCGEQEIIAIPYNDATMLITLRTEAINFPERADEIIDNLKNFVDTLDYFTPVERIQFMWGFCNNICIVNWQAAHPVEEPPAPNSGKTVCVNCHGTGSLMRNGVHDGAECPKCYGWGSTYE